MKIGPIYPWFAKRMTDEDRATLRALNERGLTVRGSASSVRGPFTATVQVDGLTSAGVGSTPAEALRRLSAKLAVGQS